MGDSRTRRTSVKRALQLVAHVRPRRLQLQSLAMARVACAIGTCGFRR